MAQDCYKLFKTTFAQALADGLPTLAAQLAAQNAQQDCLAKQARQIVTAAPIVVLPGTRPTDPGPKDSDNQSQNERAAALGTRSK
jgi:hypothetical protein